MNNVALTAALATAPTPAFAELRERPRFWFPLLLVVLTTAGITWWYYSIVDIEWFKVTVLGNDPTFQEMGEEERTVAMSMFTRTTLLWSSVIWSFVLIPGVLLLEALYLLLAGKVTKLSVGFKHWFALACWTSLPLLLGNVVSAILLFLSETPQLAPSALQPLSLNELLLHVPAGAPGHTLFESLSLITFLSCALMIIGVRSWTQKSWAFSSTLVLLPWVVIYGLWAFVTFR